MRFFQFDKDKKDDPDANPALVSANSTGPIEVLRDSATAQGDVEVTWETRLPTGRFDRRARVLADRLELAFDDKAEGPFRDRVTRCMMGAVPEPVPLR